MELYLTPLYNLEPLLEHAGGAILGIDWLSVAAVVLVTVGESVATRNS